MIRLTRQSNKTATWTYAKRRGPANKMLPGAVRRRVLSLPPASTETNVVKQKTKQAPGRLCFSTHFTSFGAVPMFEGGGGLDGATAVVRSVELIVPALTGLTWNTRKKKKRTSMY